MDYLLAKYGSTKTAKALLFELAIAYYLNNNFTKSLEILDEANGLEGIPGKEDMLFLKALNNKSLRKPKEALTGFLKLLTTAHDNALTAACETNIKELLSGTDADQLYGIAEEAADVFQASNESPQASVFTDIAAFIKERKTIAEQQNAALEKELEQSISSAAALADQDDFIAASAIIEDAISKHPDNAELLFLKIKTLVESQTGIEKAISLLTDEDYGYMHLHADKEAVIEEAQRIISSNTERGNSYFFAAFLGHLTGYDKTAVEGWLTTAERLGLKNNNSYPDTGLYVLKAAIARKNGDGITAATNYLEAGKQFYWEANYPEALKNFKLAMQQNASLNDAYKYAADTIFILSYRTTPPFSDEAQLIEAFQTWHLSPQKNVLKKEDAWHYIVIARVHEAKYNFDSSNFYDNYWNALLYAERALIYDEINVSFLTYLGRYFRQLSMEQNAVAAFTKAMELSSGGDTNLQEEMAIALLNTGQFDKAYEWLKTVNEKNTAAGITSPLHYKSWEGYIYFYREKDFTKAAALFDEVLQAVPSEMFALQMKMFCAFYQHDKTPASEIANKIVALDNSSQYPREEFNFAWAFFIAGQTDTAISRLETFQANAGAGCDQSYSLAQFYLYAGQIEKAESNFSYFIRYNSNRKLLDEFKESLYWIGYHLEQSSEGAGIHAAAFVEIAANWQQQLSDAINAFSINPEKELFIKLKELEGKSSPVCNTALKASLARVNSGQQNFTEAFHGYFSLLEDKEIFPEAVTAFENLTANKTDLVPVVTSIAFEISTDLVPPDAASPDWYVITNLIPAMKTRIFSSFGVEIPAVRIRGNDGDMAAGTCIFMLDEVPLLMCTVQKGQYFVAEDNNRILKDDDATITGNNPVTGEASAWITESLKDTINKENVVLWDEFEYIIYQLEALLCNNLELFVDDEYCKKYLDGKLHFTDEPAKGDIDLKAAAIQQNRQAFLLFKRVLKALVKEQISLMQRDIIISNFTEANELFTEVAAIVGGLRLALRDFLVVKKLNPVIIDLPADLEEQLNKSIITTDGKTFLSMVPEDCQQLLTEVRNIVGSNPFPGTMALVTSDAGSRYYLKKLVELEFPSLMILSKEEYTVPQ